MKIFIAILAVAVARRCRRRPARAAGPSPLCHTPVRRLPPTATVRLALDWTPNTNHTGFYVARREGLVRRCRHRPAGPALHQRDARVAARGPPGRVRDQLPGLADVRRRGRAPTSSRDAILQHTASAIAVLADAADPATAGPRRQDLRRLRLSERGADAQGGHQARRRQGRVQGRRRSTPRPTRRSTPSRPTSRSCSPPGRASRRSSAGSSCATSSSPTTGSRTSTRSSSPATADWLEREPERLAGSSRRQSAASSSRRRTRTRRPRS